MTISFAKSPRAIDIFASGATVLVNPVNCKGAMGKGLAETFANKYPAIVAPYKEACRSGALKPGILFETRLDPRSKQIDPAGSLVIMNFPTKDHWKNPDGSVAPSKIEYIDEGLQALAIWIDENRPKSVAVPQLGCGLGGLEWKDVAALAVQHLAEVSKFTEIQLLGLDPAAIQQRAAPVKIVNVPEFQGEYRFLSNMWEAPVVWGDEYTAKREFPCNELPYVAAKTTDPVVREYIFAKYREAEAKTPGTGAGTIKKLGAKSFEFALREGWTPETILDHVVKSTDQIDMFAAGTVTKHRFALRPDWAEVNLGIMEELNDDKYDRNPDLARKLMKINGNIVEGNRWRDTFWGKSLIDVPERNIKAGDGLNHLGNIIMGKRDRLVEHGLKPVEPASIAWNPNPIPSAAARARAIDPLAAEDEVIPPKGIVNLKKIRKNSSDPLPYDVVDLSRYSKIAFRDGTKLGNKFVMNEYGGKDGNRNDVIRKYAVWLGDQLKKPGFGFWMAETVSGKRGGCYCHPQGCHVEVVNAAATAIAKGLDPFAAILPFTKLGLESQAALPVVTTARPAELTAGMPAKRPAEPMIIDVKAVNVTGGMPEYAGIGSRETPPEVLEKMQEVAKLLAESGWRLRSGGADGADINFEKGCEAANGARQIYIPWRSFEAKVEFENTGYRPTRVGDQVHVGVSAAALEMGKKYHPAWDRLSDAAKKLHSRNCYQMLGLDLKTPVKAVLCYTPNGEMKGGTSQALRIAHDHGIPVLNMGSPHLANLTARQIADATIELLSRKQEILPPKEERPALPAMQAKLAAPAAALAPMKHPGLGR